MTRMFSKVALGAALVSTVALTAAPADAQRWGRRHYDRNNDAGVAIGAGILGLGLGLAISQDRRDRYYGGGYYDRGYYGRGYYGRGYGYGRPYYDRGYGYGRPYRGGYYGQRCVTRWAYDPYTGRRFRVRDC